MLPSIFGENLFDDMWDDVFDMTPVLHHPNLLYGRHGKNLMKTDIQETDHSYEVDIDLPGFKKDDVHIDLKNGYLTIQASKGLSKDEKDQEGRYIRRERYAGQCGRSFYVGENMEAKDVKAKFEDGILKITMPKPAANQLQEKTSIDIE